MERLVATQSLNSKMRNVICILALLCTAYALEHDVIDPSRNLERLVNIQKIAAQAILDGLMIVEERTKQNLEMKLNELKTEASIEIHKTITDAIENVNQSVEKGKLEGKKVDDCYYNARNNLEMKNRNAIAGLEACIKNGNTAMESPLANVASTIEATNKLLADLDAIIPNCYSSSFIKMQACVMTNLFLTQSTLNRIGTSARQVTTVVGIVYTKTIIDVRSCITTNAANTRTFSTDVVITTNNCIRNAPEDVPKLSTTDKPFTTDKPLTTAKSSTRKPV